MSGVEAVDIIVEHRLDGFFTRAHPSREGYDSVTRCTCDWVSYEDAAGEMQARKIHADHQVSVLAASGHTIIETEQVNLYRNLTGALGFGDNRTEPQADNEVIIEHFRQVESEAREHFECPWLCELCGEMRADTPCEHCNGSGCGPGTASGAYRQCEWCAGVGRVHVGCVEMTYIELADRVRELETAAAAASEEDE